MKKTTTQQKRVVQALYTANCWSSDQENGIALLSLGTTRKIHSEAHRLKAIKQIDHDIAWNEQWTGTPDGANDPKRDIPLLKALRKMVEDAKVGEEWISDTDNMRINEEMYQSGELEKLIPENA